jgi:hypothetical protein
MTRRCWHPTDLPDAALPRRAPARRRAPKAAAPSPDAPADAAPTAKLTRPKRAPKPRAKPGPQALLPLTFGQTPRIVIGIDPGATGAAVILRCGTSGPPTLIAAVFWQERQRKAGTVYEPTWWPRPAGAPIRLHSIGVTLAILAVSAADETGPDAPALPIHAACERQFSGRFAAAGLGVAWLAGLVSGPITDVISAPLGRPAPAEWRAVAAPHPSQRRKRSAAGDVKPCPSALGAQLAGGWPMDLLARFGLPLGSSGADLPVDLGEALGVALWQAAKTA